MHGRLVGGGGGGGGAGSTAPLTLENSLWTSWHDTQLIPMLNPSNILDYFSERTNPFYDRTCNNEIIRMQRQNLQHLENMVGIEYILLHVQGPILYVIRKQHRYSRAEVSPLADYYIIAGIVYQAPDLSSVINSRLLTTVQHLQTALEEAMLYSRYQQNKGYSWDFSSNKALSDKSKSQAKKKEEKVREEPSSLFQRKRVDMLLQELLRKFPIPPVNTNYGIPNQQQQQTAPAASAQGVQSNGGAATRIDDIKGESMDSSPSSVLPSESGGATTNTMVSDNVVDMKPPPEKKMKLS